jgi:ectoine hydroxylase-related dioxygenase (phytanoyl-CoA dioxygenase family)
MQPTSQGAGDAQALAELRREGFCLLPGVLGAGEIALARGKLDAVYAAQERELGREFLRDINELNVARLPLAYDDWFASLTALPAVLGPVRALLGEFVLLHLQNGILNTPDERHHQMAWHRDLPHQNWVISEPISVNAMFCLDPFTVETGCTHVLPRSHQMARFPGQEAADRDAVPMVAEPGSVFLFDSMLFHRAGRNVSRNVRRGINHQYTIPLFKQQVDIPRALGARHAGHPVFAQLFGYTSQSPASVEEWRRNRHHRLSR